MNVFSHQGEYINGVSIHYMDISVSLQLRFRGTEPEVIVATFLSVPNLLCDILQDSLRVVICQLVASYNPESSSI